MEIISIAECFRGGDSAILSTFIKLLFVNKIFALSIPEWQFYTDFTVFDLFCDFTSDIDVHVHVATLIAQLVERPLRGFESRPHHIKGVKKWY